MSDFSACCFKLRAYSENVHVAIDTYVHVILVCVLLDVIRFQANLQCDRLPQTLGQSIEIVLAATCIHVYTWDLPGQTEYMYMWGHQNILTLICLLRATCRRKFIFAAKR